jgi:hypothetical protein
MCEMEKRNEWDNLRQISVEQIVAVLKQAEVGVPVAELIRQVGITEQTLYRWKADRKARGTRSGGAAWHHKEEKPEGATPGQNFARTIRHCRQTDNRAPQKPQKLARSLTT